MSGVITAGVVVAAGTAYSANAAGQAARAQGRAADAWADEARGRAAQSTAAYDQYAPSQQAALDKAMAYQQQNIQRQQRLVDSIDPSLIEAGQQMHSLLQGQSAPVLKNFQDQRQLQKQQMLAQLRQQVGPGAETSSMGQNMLLKFDQETANMQNSIQQQYLDKVSNLALGGGQTLTDVMNKASGTLADLGNQMGQIGLNKANIINGGTVSMAPSQQAVVNAAGGEFKEQQIIGQGIQQLGAMGMVGAMGGYGKAAAKGAETSGTLGDLSNIPGSNAADYTMANERMFAGTMPSGMGATAGTVAARTPNFAGGTSTLGSSASPSYNIPPYLQPNNKYSGGY